MFSEQNQLNKLKIEQNQYRSNTVRGRVIFLGREKYIEAVLVTLLYQLRISSITQIHFTPLMESRPLLYTLWLILTQTFIVTKA